LPGGRTLDLGERTLVMGVINVTPDSFADGGLHAEADHAINAALALAAAGADILDIGGESTRPGAEAVSAEEEWQRVAPVLEGLRGRIDIPISIDTYKASIAEQAIDLGASVVNDVSALTRDPSIAGVVARRGAAVVLMHSRGRPAEMYKLAQYDDAPAEVARELAAHAAIAAGAGIARERILLDPGLGFAKRAEHSFAVLAGLPAIAALGYPVLVGPSRKSFLTAAIGAVPAAERDWATAAAVTASILLGAHILRIHRVAEMIDVVRTADRILGSPSEGKGQRAEGKGEGKGGRGDGGKG
jgi:dihydropteroate synthase